MIGRLIARLVAAVLLTAAATLVVPSSPAQAAYCSGGSGVSALVDYGALGGGTATGCGSGSVASAAFTSAGFALTAHPRQQTFVCKVQGKPADGDCMATDSYWGFFVSDDGQGWVYASQGVYQQAVDAGDSVALVWQSSASRRSPGIAPPVAKADATSAPTKASTPTPQPTRRPKPKASKHVDQPPNPPTTAAPSPRSTPSAAGATAPTTPARPSTTAGPSASGSVSPTAVSPTASATSGSPTTVPSTSDATPPAASQNDTDATEPTASGGGLPGWVPPLLVAVLVVGAGGVAWARRTR